MALATYTGTLTDLGLRPLSWAFPVLRVRPEREAFGPNGLVSNAPMDVTVANSGAFSMQLLASTDLVGTDGRSPVAYVVEVGRFENSIDGQRFLGVDVWRFFARDGGGPVSDMVSPPPAAGRVWVGTAPPSVDGYDFWIDTSVTPPLLKEAG